MKCGCMRWRMFTLVVVTAIGWGTVRADDALEGWWRFGGAGGDVGADSSGRGRSAEVDLDRVAVDSRSPGGGAVVFPAATDAADPADGSKSPAFIPGLAGVSLTGSVTIAAWVRAESLAPFAPILVRMTDVDGWEDGFGLYVAAEGGVGAFVRSGDDANAITGGTLRTNGWTHVTLAYSGEGLYLSVDGKRVASRHFPDRASADAAAPLIVGTLAGERGAQPFIGRIADVRLWSRCLSSGEVRRLYREFLMDAVDALADDDGDGLPNGWEVRHGLDPRDAADAAGDMDGDGVSNLDEWRLGRSPDAGAVTAPSLIRSCTVTVP